LNYFIRELKKFNIVGRINIDRRSRLEMRVKLISVVWDYWRDKENAS
jgi:hypothetical protein